MDLYKILDFVFDRNEKRVENIELEETFLPPDDDSNTLELAQRIKHEVKSGQHDQHEAIRMSFVTGLIEAVGELDTGDDSDDERSFGEEVAYNTLFHYGFYKVI